MLECWAAPGQGEGIRKNLSTRTRRRARDFPRRWSRQSGVKVECFPQERALSKFAPTIAFTDQRGRRSTACYQAALGKVTSKQSSSASHSSDEINCAVSRGAADPVEYACNRHVRKVAFNKGSCCNATCGMSLLACCLPESETPDEGPPPAGDARDH